MSSMPPNFIERAVIKNFRCLKDVEITFEPLTVLVGGNATGKTALLHALNRSTGGFRSSDYWQHDETLDVSVAGFSEGKPRFFRGYIPGRGDVMNGEFFTQQNVQFDLRALRRRNSLEAARTVDADGANVVNAFATLRRSQQQALAEQFCALVPMFADVTTRPIERGEHGFVFQDRWNGNTWYAPNDVSDGSMLVLAYLVLCYQEVQVDLLAIEEPERGLHPYLLGEIISLFRKMTRGEVRSKPVQVVLATHSAELLNHVEPREVRFFSRSENDGSVRVERAPLDTPDWKRAYEEYEHSLSGLWLSGGLGGVPGR